MYNRLIYQTVISNFFKLAGGKILKTSKLSQNFEVSERKRNLLEKKYSCRIHAEILKSLSGLERLAGQKDSLGKFVVVIPALGCQPVL